MLTKHKQIKRQSIVSEYYVNTEFFWNADNRQFFALKTNSENHFFFEIVSVLGFEMLPWISGRRRTARWLAGSVTWRRESVVSQKGGEARKPGESGISGENGKTYLTTARDAVYFVFAADRKRRPFDFVRFLSLCVQQILTTVLYFVDPRVPPTTNESSIYRKRFRRNFRKKKQNSVRRVSCNTVITCFWTVV